MRLRRSSGIPPSFTCPLLLLPLLSCICIVFLQFGLALKILPKPCSNALGEQGTCMFVWECIKTEGRHLGTCVDGFLFGSCCAHNDSSNQVETSASTDMHIKPNQDHAFASTSNRPFDVAPDDHKPLSKPPAHSAFPSSSLLQSQHVHRPLSTFTNKPFNRPVSGHNMSHSQHSGATFDSSMGDWSSNAIVSSPLHSSAPSVTVNSSRPYVTTPLPTLTASTTTTHSVIQHHNPSSSAHHHHHHHFNNNHHDSHHHHPHSSNNNHNNQFISNSNSNAASHTQFSHHGAPVPHHHHHIPMQNHHNQHSKPNKTQNQFGFASSASLSPSSSLPSSSASVSSNPFVSNSLSSIHHHYPFKPPNKPQLVTSSSSSSSVSNLSHVYPNVFRPKPPTSSPGFPLPSSSSASSIASSMLSFNPFKPTTNLRPPFNGTHHFVTTSSALASSLSSLSSTPVVTHSSSSPASAAQSAALHSHTNHSIPNHTPPSHPLPSSHHHHTHNHHQHTWNKPWHSKPFPGNPWQPSGSTLNTPPPKPISNGVLHTFRPPIFNLFRPSPPSVGHLVTFRPNMRPTVSPTSLQPLQSSLYSTRTTPFASFTAPTFTTTETSALLHPATASSSSPHPSSPLSSASSIKPISAAISHLTSHQNTTSSASLTSSTGPQSIFENSKIQCGTPQIHAQTKVVGGKNAAFGAWPWQVSVRRTSFFGFSSTHRCGGAILNQQWIATAGHCVDDLLISQIRIRVGEYDFASVLEPYPYMERSVRRKVVHPQYNFFTYENDLALVQLDEPLVFQPHIAPICLPEESVQLLGKNATVTGWGRLSEGGILPSVLQEVKVPIVSNDKCKNMFLNAGRHEYIPEIFMCAGFEEGGRDSCQGDSGGPLQVRGDDGKWFLAGIISWGIGCAEPNLPGVCTRISKFRNWIMSTIN